MKRDITKIFANIPDNFKYHPWRAGSDGFIFVDGGPADGELIGDFPGDDFLTQYIVELHNQFLDLGTP